MNNTWYSRVPVCTVVLRTKEHLFGPASQQEAPCLVRRAPTGREEGDRGSGVRHHRIQRTDSLPFLRCRPWFVVVAHHTGEALAFPDFSAFPVPCDLVPRCQLLAFQLGDAYIFLRARRKSQHEDEWTSKQGENENTGNFCPWFNFQGHKHTLETRRRTKSSFKARALNLRDHLENSLKATQPWK